MNKTQFDELLASGSLQDMNDVLGITRVHFHPFEKSRTAADEEMHDRTTLEEVEQVMVNIDSLRSICEYEISTVYHGNRYFFNSWDKLREFCDIAESA